MTCKMIFKFHYKVQRESEKTGLMVYYLIKFILPQGLGSLCISAQPKEPRVTRLTCKVASFTPKDAPNACSSITTTVGASMTS